jgi:hypothetical protein
MTTTERTFVESRNATPDDAGWRFVAPNTTVPTASPSRPARSLSWRLRH